jgi:hypothetical protein
MKIITTILAMLVLTNSIIAQVQWAKQIQSSSSTYTEKGSLVSDGTNNYIIGTFASGLYLPNDTLNANGINEIFIAKFDANGNNLWSKNIGGNSNSTLDGEYAKGAYDPINNCIYLAGHFVNFISFGAAGTLYGYSDIFLAKMDLDGNFMWAKKGGGNGYDDAQVYVNPYGKIYLVTQSRDSAYFDNYHIGPGGAIVTYDSNGNCLSAEVKYTYSFIDNNVISLNFIEKDLIFTGSVVSNNFTIDTANFSGVGDYDAFIARADSTGKIKWLHHFGSEGRESIDEVNINSNKNITFSAVVSDTLDFLGNNLPISGWDILLSTIDENGSLIWFKKFNINSNSICAVMSSKINSDRTFVAAGFFNGSADLGNLQMSSTTTQDMFIVKFDSLGNCLSYYNFGRALSNSLTIDNNNNLYVLGKFYDNVNLGNTSLSVLFSNPDLYLAKFDAATHTNTRTAPNNTLLIYANPNKGTCNITIPDDLKNSPNLTLMIYNAQGSLIQKQQIQQLQDKVKLSLDAEAKGMYNVTLTDGGKMYYGKIVFE